MVTRPSQRGLGRIVMLNHVRGHPLTKFYHLVELFGAFQDAVQGHKDLYGKGTHYRNIDHNSILLTGDPTPGRRALIVHLDNTRDIDGSAFYDDEHRGTLAFMSYEILSGRPYFPAYAPINHSDDDLPPLSSICFEEDPEVTNPAALRSSTQKDGVPHDAVHDLESFFWVFCWLCMTCEGPATRREFKRESLAPEALVEAQNAQIAIFETFENSYTPPERKKDIMTSELTFEEKILASFTPYFRPVKPVARYLYRALQRAFQKHKFDDLHTTFINVFERAEQTPKFREWHVGKSGYASMEEVVRKSREREKDVSDSPQPERVGGMERVSRATRTKRRRPMDEVEAIEEQSDEDQEDESAPASSSPSNRQGRKKRAKTATSSRAVGGAEGVAGAAARSNSSQKTAGGRKNRKTYGKKDNCR